MTFARPLSPSERWFWIVDQISPANCSGRVRLYGRLPLERLERAAAALVAEYPLLRVGVRDAAVGGPRFGGLAEPRLPVRRVVSADPEAWLRELDAEMVEGFEVGAGLARVVDVVRHPDTPAEQHDIILTISHIIVDGRSLVAALRKLIEFADPPDAVEGRENVTVSPGRLPIPPSDELIPVGARGFWRYAYTTLYDQLAALALRPRRLRGTRPVPLGHRRTRIVHRVLEAEAVAGLTADCRRAGVTVHGALAAAVARAVAERAGPEAAGVVGIGSPVDFRDALVPQPDRDELGIYAPVLSGFVRYGPGMSLWDMARSVNRQVARGVRQRRHLATVAGMRFGTPRSVQSGWRIVELIDRRAPWNVSVTNLGRAEFPDRVGEWELSGLLLAASNSCVSALTVAIVTAHREMQFGFCYVDGMLTSREAEAFADRVLDELTARPDSLVEQVRAR
ncbi:phthiocerol/phthiodiolone dimycocerosyl transferase family protein [Nocardia sp. IFM 10818]